MRLYGEGDKRTVLAVLLYVLGESLKMLHPLMPYVTEDIFDRLPMTEGLVLEASYPAPEPSLADAGADEQMELFRAVVTSTRNIRSQYHIPPGTRIPLGVRTPAGGEAALEAGRVGIMQLARVDRLDIGPDVPREKGSAVSPVGAFEVIVPLAGVIDLEEEYRRLEKEKGKIEKDLNRAERKLSNENFTAKASPEVVQRERDKREHLRTRAGNAGRIDADHQDVSEAINMGEQNGSTTGQLLRREREKKKQSIEEAHAATKISIAVLQALEEDDVTAFSQ